MTDNRSIRVTALRLARVAIVIALASALLPCTTGCLAYKVYSGIKTVGKVKDFTEDHILKDDDDDDDKKKNND